MSNKPNKLLLILSANKVNDYFEFNCLASLDGTIIGELPYSQIDEVNTWINGVIEKSETASHELWVLTPNSFAIHHSVAITSGKRKYAKEVIYSHIEPFIASSVYDDVEVFFTVEDDTANAIVIGKEDLSGLEESLVAITLPVSKILSPQSLVFSQEVVAESSPVLFNGNVFFYEDGRSMSVDPQIFEAFYPDHEPKELHLKNIVKNLHQLTLTPNLKTNAKEDKLQSNKGFFSSWIGLTAIALSLITLLSIGSNAILTQKQNAARLEVVEIYKEIFPNERIIDLPRQVASKLSSLGSSEHHNSVTNVLGGIEQVLTRVGNGNQINSLSWRRGTVLVDWQVQNQENLNRIEELLNRQGFSAMLNGWNRTESAIVGQFEVKVSK